MGDKKPCAMCRQVKPLSEFAFCESTGRYDSYCKKCRKIYERVNRKEYQKAYYQKNKQRIKEKSKQYYHDHKKRVIAGVDGNPMEVPRKVEE